MKILDVWPIGEYSKMIAYKNIDPEFKKNVNECLTNVRRWVATLWREVLYDSVYDKQYVNEILRRLERGIREAEYVDTLKADVVEIMEDALSLLISVPPPRTDEFVSHQTQHRTHVSNTAFVMMWMDPLHPELDDVWEAIRKVCSNFGIKAERSDKIEHQGKITDLVLRRIEDSEFLIADLTGERPNVYYEIGYAHALDKRPILYRKHDTKLHFDLAIHNVPEYKNIIELEKLLNSRLEAMLGRKAKPGRKVK